MTVITERYRGPAKNRPNTKAKETPSPAFLLNPAKIAGLPPPSPLPYPSLCLYQLFTLTRPEFLSSQRDHISLLADPMYPSSLSVPGFEWSSYIVRQSPLYFSESLEYQSGQEESAECIAFEDRQSSGGYKVELEEVQGHIAPVGRGGEILNQTARRNGRSAMLQIWRVAHVCADGYRKIGLSCRGGIRYEAGSEREWNEKTKSNLKPSALAGREWLCVSSFGRGIVGVPRHYYTSDIPHAKTRRFFSLMFKSPPSSFFLDLSSYFQIEEFQLNEKTIDPVYNRPKSLRRRVQNRVGRYTRALQRGRRLRLLLVIDFGVSAS
ncbi:hypothetical protein M413DRAFT_14254 [Hebeloma cylindrosporum]|uniref:Uncharacterized protein n=1 Tax=Hebeloma cylindrosporum TaxID=76867 RepID=A0A0C2Y4H0_HEBCY|nr:hypothetical protein M413DRAFT_14254 [Hebeloma cylindrosporum h7]